jgi:RecA-family ATPase
MRNVTLLTGEGAIGKSLLAMQACGAVVLVGKEWIGLQPVHGPVLYVSCEEDDDEINLRMEDVAVSLGSSRKEMYEHGLRMLSFAGEDAILAQPDRGGGIMRPTELFGRIPLRLLEIMQNNYGPPTAVIRVRWKEGVFVNVDPRQQELDLGLGQIAVDKLFLSLLRRLTSEGRNVTDKAGTSYAPAIFAQQPEAKNAKVTNKAFAESMERLFAATGWAIGRFSTR